LGYNLTWVEDPYADRRSAIEETLPASFVPQSAKELQMLTRAIHLAKEGIGGYLYVSTPLVTALVREMGEQGMFENAEDARGKLLAQGAGLTVDELNEILSGVEWPISPREGLPEVVTSAAEERIARHELESVSGYITDAEWLMQLSPAGWAREWTRWIAFLEAARDHGGLVIG
jgi:hypothetical protein